MTTSTKTQTIDDLITENPKEEKMHKVTSPTMKTKLTGDRYHWSLISLIVNGLISPIKKAQANRLDTKTQSIPLLHTGNTSQPQRQILSQSKRLGKNIPIKWT